MSIEATGGVYKKQGRNLWSFTELRILGIPHSCTIYKVQFLSCWHFTSFPTPIEAGFFEKTCVNSQDSYLLRLTLYYACYPRYLRAYRPIIAFHFPSLFLMTIVPLRSLEFNKQVCSWMNTLIHILIISNYDISRIFLYIHLMST